MTIKTDIMVVGAGPFGLSIAAHLRARGLDFRIIGKPMHSWRTMMPKGMLLKSAGFASTLHDPRRTLTLRRFCTEHGIPYEDLDLPISVETFCSYGLAFQKHFVPHLEDEQLIALNRCHGGFELRTESGKSFSARRVVIAVGANYFRHIPGSLAHLPAESLTHSAEHHDLEKFKERDVLVIGGGSSAIDIAVLLHESRARVQLISRKPTLHFGGPWGNRPLWLRMRAPVSSIGPGLMARLFTDAPWLFRYFPENYRIHTAKTYLGPSGGWFMKDRAAHVPVVLGYEIQQAAVSNGRVQLQLLAPDGMQRELSADHVIAATGYRTDVKRLPFLSPDIIGRLQLTGQAPRLSAYFESSVTGLYFAGSIAAPTFGPSMRFVCGAGFASRRISEHLARSVSVASSFMKQENVGTQSSRQLGKRL